MRYESQKVAIIFFAGALLLFAAQVSVGVIAGLVYVTPNFLAELVPFNVLRMIHTNTLIVWLLMGFMGATYYIIPEECETEIYSVKLAVVQFFIFLLAGAAAVIGYLMGIHEGREFLEQPFIIKVAIVISILLFLYNVTRTAFQGKRTAITDVLLIGLWGAALFFLFAFYTPDNLALDKMYWWYVVHLWVEGVWELIMASILGYLMIKLTGIDREIVEKWVYIIVALALITGLLGTGHHYYWIGTPGYWQWVGNIFSSLEVLPFFALVVFSFMMVWRGGRDHPNKAALLWALGCSVLAFFGAGVWGFMHTLSSINYYTHGTQITAAHGHLAFYGAYVCLNLAIMTYAFPYLRKSEVYGQITNMISFWLMSGGMVFMTVVLTMAGVVQTQLQRVYGEDFMSVQDQLQIFFTMRLGAGIIVVIGALMFIYSLALSKRKPLAGAE